MSRPIGIYNDVNIQKRVVEYIVLELGDDVYCCAEGSGRRTHLAQVLKRARQDLLPTVSPRQLRRWFYFYLKFGHVKAESKRFIRHRADAGTRRYRRRSKRGQWTTADTRHLSSIVQGFPQFYLDEIQEELAARSGKTWCYSQIWTRLLSDCGYSLQVATDRALQRNDEERERYKDGLHAFVHDPAQLIFLDETQKDRNSSRRRRYWSPRGQSPFRDAYFEGSHGKRYTLMAACDINGFVMEACDIVERETSAEDNDPTRGTVNRERFLLWIEEKLLPVLGKYLEGEPRSLVILDNASIHHGDEVKALIESTGAKVMYTAPYSPDLNPIELMFGEYKKGLKRYNRIPWVDAHLRGLLIITPQMAQNFFAHCLVPLCERFTKPPPLSSEEEDAAILFATVLVPRIVATIAVGVAAYKKNAVPQE
jgi:transposase